MANSTADDRPDVWAVQIHDLGPSGVLAFDLDDIVETLRGGTELDWIASGLDAMAREGEYFVPEVAALNSDEARGGTRLTDRQLREFSASALQVIDGQFIGIPSDATTAVHELLDLSHFRWSEAILVVKAVDSSYWVVITKRFSDIASLTRRFRDVRQTDWALELSLKQRRR